MMTPVDTIQGLVIPAEWDDDGRVAAVMISTYDEIEYQVEKNQVSGGLLKRLHQFVEICGDILDKQTDRPIIRVLAFKPIPEKEGAAGTTAGRSGSPKATC